MAAALPWVAWWADSPVLLWTTLIPALWVAFACPQKLVYLLLLATPVFPVIRLADPLGAAQVSTKGPFVSAGDPMVLALLAAWTWRKLVRPHRRRTGAPAALAGLMLLYPCVLALNMARLEPNQVLVSGLYYVKWLQYAALVFVLPGLLDGAESNSLVRSLRRVLGLAIAASALLAAYEVAESIGTGSFAAAARFPRASAFFGTLDPAKFGASEDPVNFGCFLVVAGAIALSLANRGGSRRTFGPALTVAGAVVGVLLSVSRAPLLAGAVALAYVQRWRPGRVVLTGAAVTLAAVGGLLLFPDVGAILGARVEAIADPASALESSAAGRMAAIVGAPVFDPDAFWLAGHGHSSYRFAVEPHSSQFGASVSRSLYSFPLAAWYDAGAAGLVLWVLVFVQFNRRFAALAGESVRTPGGRGGHPVVRPTADAIDSHGSRMPAADSDVRSLARGMRGALWGLAVAALFAEVPYHWRVMGVFYICAGICLSAGWNLRMGDRQPRGETP